MQIRLQHPSTLLQCALTYGSKAEMTKSRPPTSPQSAYSFVVRISVLGFRTSPVWDTDFFASIILALLARHGHGRRGTFVEPPTNVSTTDFPLEILFPNGIGMPFGTQHVDFEYFQ